MIVEAAHVAPGLVPAVPSWPFDIPCVRALTRDGLRFPTPMTFLVGENGSGKSTIVEAIAAAFGADVQGGHIGRKYAVDRDAGPLGDALQLRYAIGSKAHKRPKGYFLRAETAFDVFDTWGRTGVAAYGGGDLLEMSHGESFLKVFGAGFQAVGLYLLDEPEAALSFSSCLGLLSLFDRLARDGSQVICATHSPLLAALPGATILQLSDEGIEEVDWADLELVDHWRRFLADPDRYLRHLL